MLLPASLSGSGCLLPGRGSRRLDPIAPYLASPAETYARPCLNHRSHSPAYCSEAHRRSDRVLHLLLLL
jgi:hypothetical protein